MAQTKAGCFAGYSPDRVQRDPQRDYVMTPAVEAMSSSQKQTVRCQPTLFYKRVDRLLAVLWVILLKKCRKISHTLLLEPHQANHLYQLQSYE